MKTIKTIAIKTGIFITRILRATIPIKKYYYVLPPAGIGSLGDDAMLSGLFNLIKSTKKPYDLRQATYSDRMPITCNGLGENIIIISAADTQSKLLFLTRLIACKHFMVIGADIIDGRYSHHLVEDIVSFCNLAVKSGVPATILGFSFSDTPCKNAVKALKNLDPNVTCLCRDTWSLERFQNYTGHSAELVADLAFHLTPTLESTSAKECANWITEQKQDNKFILGLNINRLVTENIDKCWVKIYADELIKIMEKKPDLYCVFLPHDFRKGQSDLDFLSELKEYLPNIFFHRIYLLRPPFNTGEMKAIAGMVDLIIAGRMHLTIGALAQGVTSIGLTYQGKFEGLFNYFNLTDLLFNPTGLSEPGALAKHVENIIPNISKYQKSIKENIPMVIKLSAQNIKYL